jgi:translation initiation factor IF-2
LAKQTKLGVKNTQIANAVKLDSLKAKLADKTTASTTKKKKAVKDDKEKKTVEKKTTTKKSTTKKSSETVKKKTTTANKSTEKKEPKKKATTTAKKKTTTKKSTEKKATKEQAKALPETVDSQKSTQVVADKKAESKLEKHEETKSQSNAPSTEKTKSNTGNKAKSENVESPSKTKASTAPSSSTPPKPKIQEEAPKEKPKERKLAPTISLGQKLGPTGRHINDLLPQKKPKPVPPKAKEEKVASSNPKKKSDLKKEELEAKKVKEQNELAKEPSLKNADYSKRSRIKEFKDVKPLKNKPKSGKKGKNSNQGDGENSDELWAKKRLAQQEAKTDLPSEIKVRLPVSVKDLAAEMKIKASQIISKLFMQGMVLTLNDALDDETTVQLIGDEFDVKVEIDTSEDKKLRITDLTIKEEVEKAEESELITRGPVVTFMGHVDHGKTSLIDYVRQSSVAAGEAGAITQHMGAFLVETSHGPITFLDTPGHEAFTAMRARGANVTDLAILVVAGDEGIKQQTIEAIQHAKAAEVTILVAINKCDKPNFNAEDIYRQLSEQELLPEAWGGSTITVNCSAKTGEGITDLLEMIALQAEVLELKAQASTRARGTVLESEMHKGMGSVATLLVQNGTLKKGDAIVFDLHWGRVKTMRNQEGKELKEAGPSSPVEITGLSGLPEAGYEFIVVNSEKEARNIAEGRMQEFREKHMKKSKVLSLENLLQKAENQDKKILNVLLRADVQGSLEALKASLMKIESDKISLNIVFSAIGEISESDIELASASNAVVIGFHTEVESHAENLIKQLGVQIKLYDIIYHAVDGVKEIMLGSLDKVSEEVNVGAAEILATFKASQLGLIAGCNVTEGMISRNHHARVNRAGEIIWKGSISSLKRNQDDVKEVSKGFECGILLNNFNQIEVGDIIETYEIVYHAQDL